VKAAFVLLSALSVLIARGEDLAGHYVLRGVMEVGSELLLKSDGTFEVPVYSIKAGPFEINASDNDFYFEINGDAITQVLFKDEQLVIEGNDLVMKYWNKEQPIRYKKQ
jgi:hypothetical protein